MSDHPSTLPIAAIDVEHSGGRFRFSYPDSGRMGQNVRDIFTGAEYPIAPVKDHKPTVIVDVDQKHSLVQEEIFGPVLVAIPFDDEADALRMANDSPYGLGASIWSNDLAAVHRMIPRIKSGSVWVNCHSALAPALPFGGYKMSGVGREMGYAAIEHYTELKSVLIKL